MKALKFTISLVLLQFTSVQVTGAQTYRTISLDHPDGFFDVYAINDAGQIVGNVIVSQSDYHAVRREANGEFTDLPELDGNLSRAYGINELGEICGLSVDANGGGHAGVWQVDGFRELELPDGAIFTPVANDLNILGIAAGYFLAENNIPHAVVWDADGNVQTLPELDGFSSIAYAINELGEIVGSITISGGAYAVLWRPNNGGYDAIDLGSLGGPRAGANDVNNNSEVVGFSFLDETSGFTHAFVWKDGQMTDLGTLGGNSSNALAINDRGDVVGSSQVGASAARQFRSFGKENSATNASKEGYPAAAWQKRPLQSLGPDDEPFIADSISVFENETPIRNLNDRTNFAVPANDAIAINNQKQILVRRFGQTSGQVTKYLLRPVVNRNSTIANGSGRNAVTDEPVNLFTGELFSAEPAGLNLGGPMPLFFRRYYASRLASDGNIRSTIGNNWLHNFDWELTRFGDGFVEIIDNRGRLILFQKSDDAWQLRGLADIPFKLVESGAGFILADPRSQLLYTFDGNGNLIEIEDGRGNSHSLTYTDNKLAQVTDGLGRTFSFVYDENDHLESVSDGSRMIGFGYTDDNLTTFIDAAGKVTTYSYDNAQAFPGLLASKTRPEGNTPFTQTYDENGSVASQSDAGNNTYSFSYTESENGIGKRNFILNASATTLTDPNGNTSTYAHNDDGEITAFTDELGQSVAMSYDDMGRRNAITDRRGQTTAFEFDAASRYVSTINRGDGTAINLSYTARMVNGIDFYDVTGITYPDGSSDAFGYDADGNLTSVTDPAGAYWSMTHNNRGQILTVTNPEGGATTLTYNPDATLESVQDPSGNTTSFAHDNLKRLTQVTRADGSTRSFTYDDRDLILTFTDENGNTTAFSYNDNGNLTSITDPLGNTTTFAYDQQDQLVRGVDPLGNTAMLGYDGLQRIESVTDRNGNAVSVSYDALGRATAVTDPEGNAISVTYNGENAITSMADPLGNTIQFTLDELNRVTGITNALGNQTTLMRDLMGRITSVQNPLGNATNSSYDDRGLVSNIALATGAASNYTRNGLGQITSITDPIGGNWSFLRDSQGRLINASDPLTNSSTISYDNRNRPSQLTLPGGLGMLDFGFDGNNNLTSLSYSDGTGMNFTYDALNRPTAAEGLSFTYDANDNITANNGFTATHDPRGRISTMTLGTGKVVTYNYDRRNLVTTITDWLGGVTSFDYDNAGRLTKIARPNGVSTRYVYDAENRVTGITETRGENGVLSAISLTRDAFGQIAVSDRQVPLAPILIAGSVNRSFNAASQIDDFDYDGLGRRMSDNQREYTFDLASRLTGVTENGITVTFTYDAAGQRLSRTDGGVTHDFIWNYALGGLPQVSVLRENGDDLRCYVHTPGGRLLYSIEASDDSRRFYHYDEAGSTLFLTDDAGEITASYAYSPYGQILNSDGAVDNYFTFMGVYGVMREGDFDLYYMRARYYDAKTGQFISRDPIPFLDPRRVNGYQYALGNPLRFADPSGLTPTSSGQLESSARWGSDDGPFRPTPTTWNKAGPIDIYKLEDTHIFSSNAYVTGMAAYTGGGGFQLMPQGTSSPTLAERWATSGGPPAREPVGNYFFNSGNLNHPLKWGITLNPGAQIDRINVGGNESGQQSNFIGNGSDRGSASWAVDGIEITDPAARGAESIRFIPNVSAEFGRFTGGVINVITKSGGNEFSGSARINLNNDDWETPESKLKIIEEIENSYPQNTPQEVTL